MGDGVSIAVLIGAVYFVLGWLLRGDWEGRRSR